MKSTPISNVMTKNVVSVTPEQKIIDVKHIYEKKEFHHHIPVVANNKLVGMVSLIDFMYHIKGAGLSDTNKVYTELTVKDIMTENPFSLTPNAFIEEAARELAKGTYHAIPIIDGGTLVGILSTADVIRHALQSE